MHRKKSSVVIEMKDKDEDDWVFVRICPWFQTKSNVMGIYSCRPSKEEEEEKIFPIVFHSLKIEEDISGSFHHTSDA